MAGARGKIAKSRVATSAIFRIFFLLLHAVIVCCGSCFVCCFSQQETQNIDSLLLALLLLTTVTLHHRKKKIRCTSTVVLFAASRDSRAVGSSEYRGGLLATTKLLVVVRTPPRSPLWSQRAHLPEEYKRTEVFPPTEGKAKGCELPWWVGAHRVCRRRCIWLPSSNRVWYAAPLMCSPTIAPMQETLVSESGPQPWLPFEKAIEKVTSSSTIP